MKKSAKEVYTGLIPVERIREARKRVAAKRYLRKQGIEFNDIENISTDLLVKLCKMVRDCPF